jgi:23S rRNA pseudouridine1911/1915/1917 synthase
MCDSSASWGRVRRLIETCHVQVNGNLCLDGARRLHTGDVIKLWSKPRRKPVSVSDVRIVHVDSHLLVVEKPAGITSVRHSQERHLPNRRRQLQPTLDELLPPLLAEMQGTRWPPAQSNKLRPRGRNRRPAVSRKSVPIRNPRLLPSELQVFPVHRLDRDTSGLMMFARTRAAEQSLIGMFRRHQVLREYVAVCHGLIQPQSVRSLLVRDRGDGLRGSLPQDAPEDRRATAKHAVTHILNSKSIGDGRFSLVRCRLETGRTHQIRIHLSEIGHRLCGETTYILDPQGNILQDDSGATRQALHSDRLSFRHPTTGEALSFRMPWPPDLAHWIRPLLPND